MEPWLTFWTWLLLAAIAVFALLAVAVTIGGFFNVKSLLNQIDAQHAESDEDGKTD